MARILFKLGSVLEVFVRLVFNLALAFLSLVLLLSALMLLTVLVDILSLTADVLLLETLLRHSPVELTL